MQLARSYAYDWLVWALFLVLPLVIFWQCATSLEQQSVASGGPMENSARFPRMIAWLLLGLSVLNGLRLLADRVSQPSPFALTPTTRLALVVTACFVGYLLVLPYVGYHLVTPVLMAGLFRLCGLGVMPSLIGGVATSLVVAAVFQGLLNVVLPVGIFEITVFG